MKAIVTLFLLLCLVDRASCSSLYRKLDHVAVKSANSLCLHNKLLQIMNLRGGETKATKKTKSKGAQNDKKREEEGEEEDDMESGSKKTKTRQLKKQRGRESQVKYSPETLPDKIWRLLSSVVDMIWPGLLDSLMGKSKTRAKQGIAKSASAGKALAGGGGGVKGKNNKSSFGSASASAGSGGGSTARIQKELKDFLQAPPKGTKLIVGSNIRSWTVEMTGAQGTIYAGETYKLRINFPKDYPSKPPSVYFLKPTPRHRHVYSNGDICLNLLGRDWRPTLTAEGLAVSILSMLSSAKEKAIPQDNAMHADSPPGQQQQGWMYHDDKC